jgi:large subunit ribosomal protein L46
MWTFPKWYYFKKGTVAEREFTEVQKYPIPAARGVWFPQGVPDLKHGRDRRFKQDVILPSKHLDSTTEDGSTNDSNTEKLDDIDDVGRPIRPNSRITKADELNDQTSLERKLPRTLYLLIKDSKSDSWKFPSFEIQQQDNESQIRGLHQIAEDGLRTIGGDKINTWSVSNTPAAIVKYNSEGEITDGSDADLTREFLMKSHIIAGKFDLQKSDNAIKEFKWLVKEEIADLVEKAYFEKISHLLNEN